MEPHHNHFHRPGCACSIWNLEIIHLPPDIWDRICDKLDLCTVGLRGVFRLSNALGFDMTFRLWLQDYESQNPSKSPTMMFLRQCSHISMTVGRLQWGLERINSQAADIIPNALQLIKDFQLRSNPGTFSSNVPQQNTESINSTSPPCQTQHFQFGRCPDGSPQLNGDWQHQYPGHRPIPGFGRCQPLPHKQEYTPPRPCNPYSRMGTDIKQEREISCHRKHCDSQQTHLKSDLSDMSDCNDISTCTCTECDQAHNSMVCRCSADSDGGSQQSCDNTHFKALPLDPRGDLSSVDTRMSLAYQNINFDGVQTIPPLKRNDVNAVNKIHPPTYAVARESQGEWYQQKTPLLISNQTSDEDSLIDSTERHRDRAVARHSSKRRKFKAASSKRVFVTGGSSAEEMDKIKLELVWIEQLGLSVDWDDGVLEVGSEEWREIFKSATLVLIGLTRNYVGNTVNRNWLPRAARINDAVQAELLHYGGSNERFRNVLFTATDLKKDGLPRELRFAIYCFPGDKDELETSLRKKFKLHQSC